MNSYRPSIKQITIIGILGVLCFFILGMWFGGKFREDVFRLTYQFFLIAIVGGYISYRYRKMNDQNRLKDSEALSEEERRSLNRTKLKEMHSEILGAYNSTKAIRRLLCARAVQFRSNEGGQTMEEVVLAKEYDEQMQNLIGTQLVFETYAKQIKYSNLWLEEAPNFLNNVNLIEKYLNNILKEYQEKYRDFSGEPRTKNLTELKSLKEFIGPKDNWVKFESDFKKPIRIALSELDGLELK